MSPHGPAGLECCDAAAGGGKAAVVRLLRRVGGEQGRHRVRKAIAAIGALAVTAVALPSAAIADPEPLSFETWTFGTTVDEGTLGDVLIAGGVDPIEVVVSQGGVNVSYGTLRELTVLAEDGNAAGTSELTVTVTDAAANVIERTVLVTNVAPQDTLFTATPEWIELSDTMQLQATYDDAPGDIGSLVYEYDCGSGWETAPSSGAFPCTDVSTTGGPLTVKARATDKDGATSAETTATVNVAAGPPRPEGLTLTPLLDQPEGAFQLTWDPQTVPSSPGLTGYRVRLLGGPYDLASHSYIGTPIDVEVDLGITTSYAVTGFPAGSQVEVTLTALSNPGAPVVPTQSVPLDAVFQLPQTWVRPAAPTNVVATLTGADVALTWAADTNGVERYEVFRERRLVSPSTFSAPELIETITNLATTQYVDPAPATGFIYRYFVVSANDDFASLASAYSAEIDRTGTGDGSITGVISDSSGPLAGATVRAGSLATTTAADGSYTFSGLLPGTYVISADKTPNHPLKYRGAAGAAVAAQAAAVGVVVTAATTTSGVNLTLERSGSVTGRVVDPLAQPVEGVAVYLSGSDTPVATTDADGQFEIGGLPAGTDELLLGDLSPLFAPPPIAVTITAGANTSLGNIAMVSTQPQVTISALASVTEGDVVTISVTLSQARATDLLLSYETVEMTATDGDDFAYDDGTIVVPHGTTTASFLVATTEDSIAEPTEFFAVDFDFLPGFDLLNQSTWIRIDDDDLGGNGFYVLDTTIDEVGAAMVPVSVSGASTGSVDLSVIDGTARYGVHFITFPEDGDTLEFTDGITDPIGVFTPIDADTADNTFTLELGNPIGAGISDGSATVTIRDRVGATVQRIDNPNSGDPRLWFEITYTAVNEAFPDQLPFFSPGGPGLSGGFMQDSDGGSWVCDTLGSDLWCGIENPATVAMGDSVTLTVSFDADGCLAAGSCPAEFYFGPPQPANYVLDAATVISGTVTAAATGAPITGVCMTAIPITGTPGSWTTDASRAVGSGCTDVNGDYVINGLVAATNYAVRALPGVMYSAMYFDGVTTLANATAVQPVGSADFALALAPPAPPAGLVAVVNGSSVDLAWVDNSPIETGFEVWRASWNGSAWVGYGQVGIVGAGVTTLSDTPGTGRFVYLVRAFGAGGTSDWADGAEAVVGLGAPPVAPSGLSAVVNGSSVVLTWVDNSSNETGFEVWRASWSGSAWVGYGQVGIVGPGVMTLSELPGDGRYVYLVRALGAAGPSAWADGAEALVGSGAPPVAPSVLTAVVNGSFVDLSWMDNSSNETGFEIWRASWNGSAWVGYGQVAIVGPGVTSHADLPGAGRYVYLVRALGLAGPSAWANGVEASVGLGAPPLAPSGLTAVLNGSSVDLSWTDNSSIETGFEVWRASWNGSAWIGWGQVAIVGPGVSTWSGPLGNGRFVYLVRALGAAGPSAWSDGAEIVVGFGAPSGLTATVNGSSVELSWVDNSSNETGFEIWRAYWNGSAWTGYGQVAIVAPGVTVLVDTPGDGRFVYLVRALGAAGTSDWSAGAEAVVGLSGPPGAPAGLTATVNGSSVELSWSDNSSNESGFEVWRAHWDGSAWSGYGQVAIVGSDTTVLTDTPGDGRFVYLVRALGEAGPSPWSDGAEAVVGSAGPPNAPSGVAALVSGGSVELSWVDNSSTESGFEIWRAYWDGSTWVGYGQVAVVGADATSWTDVPGAGRYVYLVRALGAAGPSAWADGVEATV